MIKKNHFDFFRHTKLYRSDLYKQHGSMGRGKQSLLLNPELQFPYSTRKMQSIHTQIEYVLLNSFKYNEDTPHSVFTQL